MMSYEVLSQANEVAQKISLEKNKLKKIGCWGFGIQLSTALAALMS